MAQPRSRYSLSRIDPFSLCAIIPALALAGLCGVSGFVPGAIAMTLLALAIVALEVWVHRRDPDGPRQAPAPRQPLRSDATRAQPGTRPPQARTQSPWQQQTAVRRQPPPPRRHPGATPPQARRQQQPPPRPRMR